MAGGYDALWPRYIAATARETLSRIDLAGVRAILDVGCGSGAMLDSIAGQMPASYDGRPRLVGVDLSPRMLEVARRKLGARASLTAGDAARLPFRSQVFDVALSASVLHFWREPRAALGEIRRVLAPGGRVAITDWCADAWIERFRDRILRVFEPAHFRVYRTADLVGMLESAGFDEVGVQRWRIGWRWSIMTATGRVTPSSAP